MKQNLKIILKMQKKIENSFQNSFKLCQISAFNCLFLGSVILCKLTTTVLTDIHIFGLV